jgi:hypothetical protein
MLFFRSHAPYLIKTNGITPMLIDTNPKSELAQLIPSFVYIAVVANGRATANRDRKVDAAAAAEAEYCWYASVR